MNKLFSKIAGLSIGLAMAIGVGVAAGSKEAKVASAADQTDSLTAGLFTATSTTYTAFSDVSATSDAVYAGKTAKTSSGGIQIRSKSSDTGIITTGSGGKLKSISIVIESGSNTIDFYGKTSAYSAVGDLYGSNKGTKIGSASATGSVTLTNPENYTYLGIRSNSGACYITSISVTWTSGDTKTLSSISVSGYKTDFTVGDAFSFGGTVTATYSNSDTADVTSSTTFSGYNMSTAGDYTVTASYTEGGVSKTATYSITVSAPSTPFITPAKSSTSGYTGTNESLSFTYGNLTGSLSVTSSNTSVVTVETPSTSAGSGTVQINFVAEGSTTVKFKDGSTELASVSVSVSDPTVNITGMPSARSIATGAILDLGSLITVTPTGNLSSDVTWSSSNPSFASVTQSGVVTGEAVGSATITVTPDDYHAGAVSCTVTVANVMTAVFGTTGSSSSAEVTDASKYKTDYSYTIDTNITLSDISKVYPQTSNALKFGSSSVVGSMTFSIPSTIDSKPVYITSVTVRAVRYHETKGTTMLIGGVEKTLTYSADDYTADLSSGEVTSFVLTADSSSSDKRMYVQSVSIQYAFKKTLSSIALSGSYQTTFFKGDTFNHDGLVVTATYSDSSTADVTSSATFSGYNLSNTGNQTVTVSYTEGTTKTATYSITVSYAAVTSVTLSQNSAEIGLNETFNYTLVTVTVSPDNANKEVTWSVSASTVGTDYVFDESGLLSGDTEGTITLKCESVADSSKYATIVVSVTGDPTAEFAKESTSGYAGKSEVIAFTYGNIDDVSKITVVSSNTSYVTVANDLVADEGEGLVTINFVAAGSANVTISYDGGATLDTLTVSVSADSVASVSWDASNFDVFSGTTLTSDIDNTWLASYEMASGDEGLLEYGDYTLKLGGTAITLPHTWVAADDGKELCIEYGGVSSSSVAVAVTQTLNDITKVTPTVSDTVSWTADAADNLGSKISSQGGTDEGTISTGDYSWSYTRTLVSLASNKSDYISFQGNTWIQLGSGNALESLEFTTSAIPGTIKSVTVVAATAGSHTLTIDVGGTKYLEDESLYAYSGTAAADNPNPDDCIKTGTGTSSGAITITIAQSGTTKKAMVIRSISVSYEITGGSSVISNSADHKVAQRAVVKFAKAFNAAVATGSSCSTEPDQSGTTPAWDACQTAYSNFLNDAASDLAYAKDLIRYATQEYSDSSDEACVERMVTTYKILVGRGYTAFMSEIVSAGKIIINPLQLSIKNSSAVITVVAISALSLAAIGGYFLFRRRKEQ